ncbi:MAG: alanine racemase [Acidimicrobiia bacterium]
MQQRPTHATIDLAAIEANARLLVDSAAPARLMAVVKADGYGHGSVPVAQAALEGGATWLGVALVEEGRALRAAGITAPLLLFSEPPTDAAEEVVQLGLTPVVYTEPGIRALGVAARAASITLGVHLKVDTGMRRVGAEPEEVLGLARLIVAESSLQLEGIMSHLAVADEPGDGVVQQCKRFDEVLAALEGAGIDPGVRHIANSAALLAHPETRYDMVRVGIALYGLAPVPTELELKPAMSLVSAVSFVKRVHADEAVSYGWRYRTQHETTIATVPIGYADGVRRALHAVGGEVLIRGQRLPLAGTITMDQIMVDVGNADVHVGDLVTLIGTDGGETVTADEWARALGTISYEIVCSLSPRVPRVYSGAQR